MVILFATQTDETLTVLPAGTVDRRKKTLPVMKKYDDPCKMEDEKK